MRTENLFSRMSGLLGRASMLAAACSMMIVSFVAVRTARATEKPAGSILFLSLDPKIDPAYKAKLVDNGYTVASASLKERLDPEFIRKFNVIVIDQTVLAGNQYNIFGQYTIKYLDNLDNVWKAVNDGAGVLVYPSLTDIGGSLAVGFNETMKPFGLSIYQASAYDTARMFNLWEAYGTNGYAWTEAVEPHPATKDVKRIYYPAGSARWDDCYFSPPLMPDKNWTVLVRGMPGSVVAISADHQWSPMEGVDMAKPPVLAAAREVGKGRMAVLSPAAVYIHRYGYTSITKGAIGEQSVGVVDGIILEKGDGLTPSDTGRFVMQLYGWLGEKSAVEGLGGYAGGDPVVIKDAGIVTNYNPVLDVETMTMPPSWKHAATRVWRGSGQADYPEMADPVIPGDIRFFKGLIGARTSFSDGKGTPAEYASAAREAGYSMIAFTETFESLSADEFQKLTEECESCSSDDLVCLPGFDIMDLWGNHFLVIGAPFYPRKQWLSEDGKRLAHPAYINLCYGNHIVAAHRTTSGPTPNELLKHWQGFTVYTYRNGKLAEDASENFAWQADSASVPHPLAVHEIFSPSEVAAAARTGYQQLLPADTLANAVGYFRVGLNHYFDGPSRYLISGGPIATTWVGMPKDAGPEAENREIMRVDIAVTNDRPLVSVELRDGFGLLRRWLPEGNHFEGQAFLQHSRQRSLFVTAKDDAGRGMLTSVLRTVPGRYHFRCADRQNWLGHVCAWYPGTHLPFNLQSRILGLEEAPRIGTVGKCMAPKLDFPFTAPDVITARGVLEQTYIEATANNTWGDARPAFPTRPSEDFEGSVMAFSFTRGKPGRTVVSMVEYDLVLKKALQLPEKGGGLLLTVAGVMADSMLWMEKGEMVSGPLPKSGDTAIPVHGLAGGFIPLTPGLGVSGRSFGLLTPPAKDGKLPAGYRIKGSFLMTSEGLGVTGRYGQSFQNDPTNWMTQFGFLGDPPYALKLTSGGIEIPSFPVKVRDDKGIISGSVVKACTNMLFDVPLEFTGLNPNLPVGIWQEGDERVSFTGVFEGRAWPRLDVARPGAFVAGQLVAVSDPAAVIEVVSWNKDRVKLDVHNPTDKPMKLHIRTAPIPGFKSLDTTMELPPGTSSLCPDK